MDNASSLQCRVWKFPAQSDSPPGGGDLIFPGSFAPLHSGHRQMAAISKTKVGTRLWYEMSKANADKPSIGDDALATRLQQNFGDDGVVVSNAITFAEKSKLFANVTFVIGADTIMRVTEPRFYGGDRDKCRSAIGQIARNGCRFLVFGRKMGDEFVQQRGMRLSAELESLCDFIGEAEFRDDISSTSLRQSSSRWPYDCRSE